MDIQADKIPVITGFQGDIPQQSLFPWFYNPLIISKETHPISKNLDAIKSTFTSTIDTIKSSDVKKSIVLTSSPYSKVVLSPHRVSLAVLENEPQDETIPEWSTKYWCFIEGSFKSCFENRLISYNNPILTKSLTYKHAYCF